MTKTNEHIFANLVPINYMGGAGGNFICNFITAAKLGINRDFTFGDSGSMHYDVSRVLEIPVITHDKTHDLHTPHRSLADKLLFYQSMSFNDERVPHTPPFFTTIHSGNFAELQRQFPRIIHLWYTEADTDELAAIFMMKKMIPDGDIEPPIDSYFIENVAPEVIKTLKQEVMGKYLEEFSDVTADGVCSISWEETIRGDPSMLVNKLSKFTGIPKEHFNVVNLLSWRKETLDAISVLGI